MDQLESEQQAHLSRVEALIQSGQVAEAIEALRRIIDTHGDKLVELPQPAATLPAGFRRYTSAREFGLARLANLRHEAPQEFEAYRRRIDPLGDRLLEQANRNRDEAALYRIVQEFFLSRAGDDALLRLGELALERGQYNSARRYWERLHATLRFPDNDHKVLQRAARRPLWLALREVNLKEAWPTLSPILSGAASFNSSELVYPDTDLRLADVRARLVLTSILEGNLERARIEIGLLKQMSGDVVGTLAGRQGNLVEFLESFLEAARSWPVRRPSTDWPTFSGDTTRNHAAQSDMEVIDQPLWSAKLPRRVMPYELLTANRVRVAEPSDGLLCYHPLIVKENVIVQTGPRRDQVVAYDLRSGQLQFPVGGRETDDETHELGRATIGVPRFTIGTHEDQLFVRTGIPLSLVPGSRDRHSMPTKLEALELSAEGKLAWTLALEPPLWNDQWTLGGPPLADGKQLFVSVIRRGPLRIETHVAALDLVDGRVRWRRFVCAAEPSFDDNTSLFAHNLLTVRENVVYCNTNHGAVAALDARSGAIQWLTTYPRTALAGSHPDRNDLHFYRDLNPCVLFQDFVLVAPQDCSRLFALDVTTGIPVWVTRAYLATDAIHLLGVGANNLVAAGECLYWFDVHTGQLVGQFPGGFLPAPGFARPSPRGCGRGILAGQHVYWPTHEAIFVFDQRTARTQHGWQPRLVRQIPLAPCGATGGNLIAANGVLLIAGADQLWAFSTTGKRPTPVKGPAINTSSGPFSLHETETTEHGTRRRSTSRAEAE